MILYAESSAVLTWLLGEPGAGEVANALRGASAVVTSSLTLVEVDRALLRAVAINRLPEAQAAHLRVRFESVVAHWSVAALSPAQVERARRAFPVEPIRSLDALHLAAALEIAGELGSLAMVSLDKRVRDNVAPLGLRLVPE